MSNLPPATMGNLIFHPAFIDESMKLYAGMAWCDYVRSQNSPACPDHTRIMDPLEWDKANRPQYLDGTRACGYRILDPLTDKRQAGDEVRDDFTGNFLRIHPSQELRTIPFCRTLTYRRKLSRDLLEPGAKFRELEKGEIIRATDQINLCPAGVWMGWMDTHSYWIGKRVGDTPVWERIKVRREVAQ